MQLRRSFARSLALVAVLSPATALAQSSPETPAATPVAQPANTLTEEQRAEARAALRRGNELFNRNNYEAALTEFLRVYEVAQSRPNAFIYLLNIARCYERMFRYDQAIQYFQRYLERAPADDADRAAAQATITALEGLLGTLEIQSNVPDAQVWVDDRQVADRAGTVRIPGGVHVVELRARGYAPSRQQVQLPARTTQALSFRLERLNVRRGLHPAFFATVAGVGVASGVTGIVFGARALGLRGEVDRLAASPATANSVGQDQKDQIRTAAVVADVMFAVTGVAAIGATLLGVATEWRRPAEQESPARAALRLRWAPMVSADVRGITVGGAL
ncbi:MAG: tetratricopeptide repeat protein [Polyangiales bacterium]